MFYKNTPQCQTCGTVKSALWPHMCVVASEGLSSLIALFVLFKRRRQCTKSWGGYCFIDETMCNYWWFNNYTFCDRNVTTKAFWTIKKAHHHFIIRQPLCPVVERRPQHAVSKLPCLVLSSAISCRSSICPKHIVRYISYLVKFSIFLAGN